MDNPATLKIISFHTENIQVVVEVTSIQDPISCLSFSQYKNMELSFLVLGTEIEELLEGCQCFPLSYWVLNYSAN